MMIIDLISTHLFVFLSLLPLHILLPSQQTSDFVKMSLVPFLLFVSTGVRRIRRTASRSCVLSLETKWPRLNCKGNRRPRIRQVLPSRNRKAGKDGSASSRLLSTAADPRTVRGAKCGLGSVRARSTFRGIEAAATAAAITTTTTIAVRLRVRPMT